MSKALQVAAYTISLLLILFIGNIFDVSFWQAGIHYQALHPPTRVPMLSAFWIQNHGITTYVLALPWIGFVGLPLLFPHRMTFWDSNLFSLRFSVFILCEFLIISVMLFALFRPLWIYHYYGVLDQSGPTSVELFVGWLFWILVSLPILGFVFRGRLKK